MKVAISSSGEGINAEFEPRFGRCKNFVIYDTENKTFKTIPNPALEEESGAGIKAAKEIIKRDVKMLITGRIGLNALKVLSSSGVRIVKGSYSTVKEAIEKEV